MKKLILLSVAIVISLMAVGQARLNLTVEEIKEEFAEYEFKTGTDKDGDFYLSITLERAFVTYYFKNKESKCYVALILPLTQGDLNYYVETYNKSYAILSPTQWRMYSNVGYADIMLRFDDVNSFFLWTIPE